LVVHHLGGKLHMYNYSAFYNCVPSGANCVE
jgi:hypothetical protein